MPLAFRDVEYFLEVARCGQLTQAAAALQVTSAALSKAVRRLEEELALRLFDRTGNGMALTTFGAAFLQRAERLKAEHDDALRHAGEVRAGRAGLLRIGATQAVLEPIVSPAIARLQPRRPGLRISLAVSSSDVLLERTRRGELDGAVVPLYESEQSGLRQVMLGSDALVPVAREGQAVLRQRRALTLAQLATQPWILPAVGSAARTTLDGAFFEAGVQPPQGAIEVDFSSSWALLLVRTTDLLALVPRSALAGASGKGVRVVDAPELELTRTIGLFARPDVHWSPLMKEFADALKWQGNVERDR